MQRPLMKEDCEKAKAVTPRQNCISTGSVKSGEVCHVQEWIWTIWFLQTTLWSNKSAFELLFGGDQKQRHRCLERRYESPILMSLWRKDYKWSHTYMELWTPYLIAPDLKRWSDVKLLKWFFIFRGGARPFQHLMKVVVLFPRKRYTATKFYA